MKLSNRYRFTSYQWTLLKIMGKVYFSLDGPAKEWDGKLMDTKKILEWTQH